MYLGVVGKRTTDFDIIVYNVYKGNSTWNADCFESLLFEKSVCSNKCLFVLRKSEKTCSCFGCVWGYVLMLCVYIWTCLKLHPYILSNKPKHIFWGEHFEKQKKYIKALVGMLIQISFKIKYEIMYSTGKLQLWMKYHSGGNSGTASAAAAATVVVYSYP